MKVGAQLVKHNSGRFAKPSDRWFKLSSQYDRLMWAKDAKSTPEKYLYPLLINLINRI
jgi:hypothetical protein